jgi:glycine/D-amino acid oxidase-like deaminating enzyme
MKPQSPEVLVVGAGIVGAACALELAREGLTVEILDAASVGSGATAEGMGHLVTLDDSEAQLALSRASLALWDALAPELPAACDFRRCGTIWIAEDEDERELVERKARLFAERGVAHEVLDERGLREAEPRLRHGLAGGLRVPGDGVVYPPAAAAALAERACRDHGARLTPGRAVRRIEDGTSSRPPRLVLADGDELEADFVVDAAGAQALEIVADPPAGAAIRPRKGHLVITERYPGFCRHQLVELGYLKSAHSHAAESVAFNLQPRPNGQLLLGSSRQYGETSREIDDGIVRRMVRRALDFMPELAEALAVRAWTGFRAATADHLPLIGPLPGRPRVVLAAGHEGHGITTSLATARLVTDALLGREPPIPAGPYLPDRCRKGGSD